MKKSQGRGVRHVPGRERTTQKILYYMKRGYTTGRELSYVPSRGEEYVLVQYMYIIERAENYRRESVLIMLSEKEYTT